MYKLSRVILFLYLCYLRQWFVKTQQHKKPPASPRWHVWAEEIVDIHLTNMTAELLKDMTLKLEQAKTIQKKYMYSMTYELGTIAANIQDAFQHMLDIYRKYANLKDFINGTHNLDEILNAYHVIPPQGNVIAHFENVPEGDYNQIRFERDLFFETLEKHQKIKDQKRQQIRQQAGNKINPNEDKILEMMEQNEQTKKNGRRAFGFDNGTLKAEPWSDFDESNAQVPQVRDWAARRRSGGEDGAGLPRETIRSSTVKRLWNHHANFPDETRLDY